MSDLISRSELLKQFCITKDGHRIPERDCDNFEVTVSIKDVKTIIREQPTAYDVDKVIEELKEFLINYGVSEKSSVHQRIIEIVKQCGVGKESD